MITSGFTHANWRYAEFSTYLLTAFSSDYKASVRFQNVDDFTYLFVTDLHTGASEEVVLTHSDIDTLLYLDADDFLSFALSLCPALPEQGGASFIRGDV